MVIINKYEQEFQNTIDKLKLIAENTISNEVKDDILILCDNLETLESDVKHLTLKNKNYNKLYNSANKINKSLEQQIKNSNIEHQKLLEEYQQLSKENNILKTKDVKSDELSNLNNSLNDKLNESKSKIISLTKDKQYYMAIINKLTNILNSETPLNEISKLKLVEDIPYSPYYRLINDSGLFDSKWYKDEYLSEDIDPLTHFITTGYLLDYNPSPNFNTKWYCQNYPYVKKQGLNPLIDYITYGIDEKRTILPPTYLKSFSQISDTQNYIIINESDVFDKEWYKKEYKLNKTVDAVEHYLTIGSPHNFAPIKDFDVEWYRNNYELKEHEDTLVDYITHTGRQIKAVELYNTPEGYDIRDTHQYQLIKELEILDKILYTSYYKVNPNIDLIEHFLKIGYKKGYKLNKLYEIDYDLNDPLFGYLIEVSSKKFVQKDINEFLEEAPVNIEDTIEYQILKDDEAFDADWYNNQNLDVKRSQRSPLEHYILFGCLEKRNPNKNFDNELYYQNHPNTKGRINPLIDYIFNGKTFKFIEEDIVSLVIENPQDLKILVDSQEYRILEESSEFDEEYYLENNPDVKMDPIIHFLEFGWKEGRNPNSKFNLEYYMENEVIDKSLNPLIDSIFNGLKNYKVISNLQEDEELKNNVHDASYYSDYVLLEKSEYFDESFYRKNNPNIGMDDAIEYYLKKGFKEDYSTCKSFNPYWYLKHNLDVRLSGINPLIHYIKYGKDEDRQYRSSKIDLSKIDEVSSNKTVKLEYDAIYDSIMFDEEYYLTKNPEIRLSGINPILHYILYGADSGLNPSKYFNTKQYLSYNKDVALSDLNPLYHYIAFGKEEKRPAHVVYSEDFGITKKDYSFKKCKDILKQLKNKISIIIPIYNAYEETKECIQSVLLNTNIDYELILINDCSSDPRIDKLLDKVRDIPFVKIINNTENKGFVKNVNIGLTSTEGDVVLLNSDTIVTPRWLTNLVISAYSDNKIATVTPFCNSSDISIPELATEKNTKFLNKSAYQINKLSNQEYLESPTGNGFCLFIKRDVIEDIGLFDEIFGQGYGEETDFTSRAEENGWKNIRNDSVFVYHRRHASFSEEKSNLLKEKNKEIQLKRHPNVFNKWNVFINSDKLKETVNNIKDNLEAYKNAERILYVTYVRENEPYVNDDFYKLAENYDIYVLTIMPRYIRVWLYYNNEFIVYQTWNIQNNWSSDNYQRIYFNILLNLKIDIFYIRYVTIYHNPNLSNLSSFIKFAPFFDIKVMSEGTIFDLDLLKHTEELLNPIKSFEEVVNEKSKYIDFKNNKTVIYTAITGNYDDIETPSVIDLDFDYICFTDNPDLKSNFWQIRYMEDLDLDEIRKARRYKILPHKYLSEYDYSIWIDGNFDIIGDIKDYIHKNSKNNKLLAIKHEVRDCIYEEGVGCLDLEKDSIDIIDAQLSKYKDEEYPEHNGLVASGILFRNHHDLEVIKVMEDWYHEVINYSRRDQLSFNYVCWKNNFKYDESLIFYYKNEYFQRLKHANEELNKLKYTQKQSELILNAFDEKTSIIIPIYNAYEETKECIKSVEKYTTIPYELVLINDCSSDKRIDDLLKDLSKKDNIKVINNKRNQGFVKNVNMGFKVTSSDVVLLNSDTIVTPKWLQKLKATAYTSPKIATVTPFSNNAGAFSVPLLNEENDINPELGLNGTSNIIEKISDDTLIYAPTGNGFCMYIKRDAINSVGFFDQKFGRGYGEENDFCMRLKRKGRHNVIDTSTYIFHNRSVSFSDEKDKLMRENRKYLDSKHPNYKAEIDNFVHLVDYKKIREDIRKTLNCDNPSKFNRKRILYLLHEGNGGTLHTSIELMSHIHSDMDAYLLTAGRKEMKLYKYSSFENKSNQVEDNDDEFMSHLQLITSWNFKSKLSLLNPFIPEFRRIYYNVLKTLKIDIVHIRHLIRHSLDMPYIAKKLGIPVILSFHDFYYICPSHNLIDDCGKYCAGHCSEIYDDAETNGQCQVNMGLNVPLLKLFVEKWREYVSDMFKCCDAFVTTAKSAYNLYTEFYPELKDKQFEIIEHGRDLETPSKILDKLPEFKDDEPIRILFPGHINVNKGGWLIRDIKSFDKDDKLEFHYMGNIHGMFKLEEIGTHHGYYNRSEFCREVHEINPHFIGLLSIWPETYCHTLTEAWSCGIPVITLDIGALGERVRNNGGGFFIENDGKKAYNKIIDISKNQDEYEDVASQISKISFKSTKKMSEEYMSIYKKYLLD